MSLQDKVTIINQELSNRDWYKLVKSDEYKILEQYIQSRIESLRVDRERPKKHYSLDAVIEREVIQAIETELTTLLKQARQKASNYIQNKKEI